MVLPAAAPPSRWRPGGNATISGSVDAGQPMLRPVSTARSLVLQGTRVHTRVKLPDERAAVI
jgi:hypothetical protein